MRPDRTLRSIGAALDGAVALEPGGPSGIFENRGLLPLYRRLSGLDTLDFRERTLWSEDSRPGPVVRGRLIGEAGHLKGIDDGAYDALLASHVLEHIADPLGALGEWRRVVRKGGFILLVVPHYEGTFDHRRSVTSLEHLRADAKHATGEDDLSHLPEIVELHDLERDPGALNSEHFEQRCRDNLATRGMHHHVFDSLAVANMCREAGLELRALRARRPFHIFCLCQVGSPSAGISDRKLAASLARSPFKTDRAAST